MDNEQREHLLALRQTYLRRLRVLEKQQAKYGIDTRPEIVTEITATEHAEQLVVVPNDVSELLNQAEDIFTAERPWQLPKQPSALTTPRSARASTIWAWC